MPEPATAARTRSASWPMMAYTSLGGTTLVAAAITWASKGLPPTSCSTLGCLDFSRVPLPAAMMAIAMRGVDAWFELLFWGFDTGTNIPREYGARQVHFSMARPQVDGGTGA